MFVLEYIHQHNFYKKEKPMNNNEIQFINLTPHDITVLDKDGNHITIERSGTIARINSHVEEVKLTHLNKFNVTKINYNGFSNLPELDDLKVENKSIIVSSFVLDSLPLEWSGVAFAPDTSPESCIRDEKGLILAVKNLRTI